MSRRRRSSRSLLTWTLIGVIVGLILSGPLLYSGQISSLNDRIDELEGGAQAEPHGSLTIAGSSTVLPITQEIAKEFITKYKRVEISVAGGGSGHGIKAAGSGEVDIGEASRNIKDTEYLSYPDLVAFSMGKDSVAIVVNPENTLAGDLDLTLEEISKVFSGEIDNWSDLGGEDHTIEVYTREAGSGTREVFDTYVLEPHGVDFVGDAGVKPSNGEMRASVAGNRYGIAYISLGYVDEAVTAITVQGVEATVENVNSGDYPLTRILWIFTNGMSDPLERAFIEFVRGEEGQAIVEDFGYIPIR